MRWGEVGCAMGSAHPVCPLACLRHRAAVLLICSPLGCRRRRFCHGQRIHHTEQVHRGPSATDSPESRAVQYLLSESACRLATGAEHIKIGARLVMDGRNELWRGDPAPRGEEALVKTIEASGFAVNEQLVLDPKKRVPAPPCYATCVLRASLFATSQLPTGPPHSLTHSS